MTRKPQMPDLPITPHFSIVTVCWNSATTIGDTVRSVRSQVGVKIEHIIKDAGSTDATVKIAKQLSHRAKIVVKPDRGIYDAMNQGFQECIGEYVGYLNSDDYYASNDVLNAVGDIFSLSGCDIVYGDISMVNTEHREIRKWTVGKIPQGSLGGKQLPHPALFVRRETLALLTQPFDSTYRISADLKQQLTLIEKMQVPVQYLPKTLTIMRTGGESTGSLKMVFLGWSECARAYREVLGRSGWGYVARKVASKISQLKFSRARDTDNIFSHTNDNNRRF